MDKKPLAMWFEAGDNTLEIVRHCGKYSQRIYLLDIEAILATARQREGDHVGFSVFLNGQISQSYDTEFSCTVATPHPITPVQLVMAELRKSKESSATGPSESNS